MGPFLEGKPCTISVMTHTHAHIWNLKRKSEILNSAQREKCGQQCQSRPPYPCMDITCMGDGMLSHQAHAC